MKERKKEKKGWRQVEANIKVPNPIFFFKEKSIKEEEAEANFLLTGWIKTCSKRIELFLHSKKKKMFSRAVSLTWLAKYIKK